MNIYISLYNWAYDRARTHLCCVSPGQSRLATENESEVKINVAGDVADSAEKCHVEPHIYQTI